MLYKNDGTGRFTNATRGARLEDKKGAGWDAVALGIIVMVLSGLYMWYQLLPKRRLGLIVLGLGVLSCGFFVFGLGFMP